MTQINLLPWREQERKEKKYLFAVTAGIFFAAAIFLIVVIHFVFYGLVDTQLEYNQFLTSQLQSEQDALTDLSKKQKAQNAVIKQVQFIISLRDKSYQVVQLFNELPRVVPETVLILKLSKNDNLVSLSGVAQSNLQVSLMMQNIEKSKVFNQPTLTQISEGNQTNGKGENFELKVTQQE